VDMVSDRATQIRRERDSGQTSLFGDAVEQFEGVNPADASNGNGSHANGGPEIPTDEKLRWEREFLGMYLSDHPLRRIAGELRQRVDTSINEVGPHLDGLLVQIGCAV